MNKKKYTEARRTPCHSANCAEAKWAPAPIYTLAHRSYVETIAHTCYGFGVLKASYRSDYYNLPNNVWRAASGQGGLAVLLSDKGRRDALIT